MKSILCIITLFAACAANVYAHGTCQHFHDRYFRIIHFTPGGADDQPRRGDDGKYQHGHKQVYLSTDKTYAWAYFSINYDDPANFDISDWTDYVDCPAVVPGTNGIPNPDPNKVDDENLIDPGEATNPMPVNPPINPCDPVMTTPTTPIVPSRPVVPSTPIVPSESVVRAVPTRRTTPAVVPVTPNPCDPPLPAPERDVVLPPTIIRETITYTMTFPQGVSALHLPFPSARVRYFTDLYYFLGDDNVHFLAALRPTVQVWSVVRSAESQHDEWISPYRGFVANVQTEVTLELALDNPRYSYTMMYLKTGYNLVGVPRRSLLETVADFYDVFPTVESVKGLDPDIEVGIDDTPSVDWFIDLAGDTEIDCCTAYLIYSNDDAQYPVWGFPWHYEPSSAAPAIRRVGKLAVTWGGLKSGKLY